MSPPSMVKAADEDVILDVKDLTVRFPVADGQELEAVRGVSLSVRRGETVGLVGESGCGKTSLGKAIMQLQRPSSGQVLLNGTDLTTLKDRALRPHRQRMQMVFQNPIASLNPRRRIVDVVAESLRAQGGISKERARARAAEVLTAVGLDVDTFGMRHPHELSGGQCQRVSIARALVFGPDLLVCDEPVSALDVSVQAQILNLLEEMKAEFGLTMLFIAHDLAVVKNISDRLAVMYLGGLCELGDSQDVYRAPAHPYTQLLLSSIPEPDPEVAPTAVSAMAAGDLPSPLSPPSGCRFRTRCPYATERCAAEVPMLRPIGEGRVVACHFPLIGAGGTAEQPRLQRQSD